MSALWLVVGLVALQRLAELAYARRNEQRLRAEGGVETGAVSLTRSRAERMMPKFLRPSPFHRRD